MKTFDYIIKDELGIHARPAGLLVKLSKEFESEITIIKEGKSVDTKKLMALMGLGVRNGNQITIQVQGKDEDTAIDVIKKFFEENL